MAGAWDPDEYHDTYADGCELRFTVPAVVQRGAELGQIARIVIAAQERAERSEGLGA